MADRRLRLPRLAVVAALVAVLTAAGAPSQAAPATAGALRACTSHPGVECGSIRVPLYRAPGDGSLVVHFRVYLHTDPSAPALEPVVAFEGGPGYGSIGSASYYRFMLGPLNRTHDLIVMDQRGTGTSAAIACHLLQDGIGSYALAVGALRAPAGAVRQRLRDGGGRRRHGRDPGHARHPTPWTCTATPTAPTRPRCSRSTTPASCAPSCSTARSTTRSTPSSGRTSVSLRHAWVALCRRAGRCPRILQSIGDYDRSLASHPLVGTGTDADGGRWKIHLTPSGFAELVTDATYTTTTFRDLPAALAAARGGDPTPMLRLAAEDAADDAAGGSPSAFSAGDEAAVSCHDFPTVWNPAASVKARRRQLDRAIDRLPAAVFAPFAKPVWLGALYEHQLVYGCLRWPQPRIPDPPFPPGLPHPHTPVLVLNGEFDQATPIADARRVARAFPDATLVEFRNTGHITALADYERCGSVLARRFIATLHAGDSSCARRIPPVNVVPVFPRRLAGAPATATPAPGDRSTAAGRRAAWVAAETVGDAYARWYSNMYGIHGVGLRGGRYTIAGGYESHLPLVIHFHADRFVSDVATSGAASWNRRRLVVRAQLRLSGAVGGTLTLRFATNVPSGGVARVSGRLDGRRVELRVPAPWSPQG